MGVDLVMHSGTKFLNGHSDHLCGAIAGRRELVARVRTIAAKLGAVLDAQVAYDLLRGLKTFAVRLERQCASALTIHARAVPLAYKPAPPGSTPPCLASARSAPPVITRSTSARRRTCASPP